MKKRDESEEAASVRADRIPYAIVTIPGQRLRKAQRSDRGCRKPGQY